MELSRACVSRASGTYSQASNCVKMEGPDSKFLSTILRLDIQNGFHFSDSAPAKLQMRRETHVRVCVVILPARTGDLLRFSPESLQLPQGVFTGAGIGE